MSEFVLLPCEFVNLTFFSFNFLFSKTTDCTFKCFLLSITDLKPKTYFDWFHFPIQSRNSIWPELKLRLAVYPAQIRNRPKVLCGVYAESTHFPLVFRTNKFLQDTFLSNVFSLGACLREVWASRCVVQVQCWMFMWICSGETMKNRRKRNSCHHGLLLYRLIFVHPVYTGAINHVLPQFSVWCDVILMQLLQYITLPWECV